ncbi:MAG: ATP-binding cassette domain-containing protein, partial [Jatrophihabitans sp.]|uniref:ATP-binding cassette domain-containing protein n=1 Tax=Jatrophihabitans sp. TaxID=1932789 RepID=UPI003F7D632E
MTTDTLLQVYNLDVLHGRGRSAVHAVRGVDLTVGRGRTVGVVGESGSGKSSLGNAILGLAAVRSGSVIFDGADNPAAAPAARRRLRRRTQVIVQAPDRSLHPARTGGDTLVEGLRFAQR